MSMHMARFRRTEVAPKIVDDVIKATRKKQMTSSVDLGNAVCKAFKKEKHHELCDTYSLVWLRLYERSKIRSVVKKNGSHEKFSPEKLFKSVQKSFRDSYIAELHLLQPVVREVLAKLEKKHAGGNVSWDEIRDTVELILIRRKLLKVAKNYLLYKYH